MDPKNPDSTIVSAREHQSLFQEASLYPRLVFSNSSQVGVSNGKDSSANLNESNSGSNLYLTPAFVTPYRIEGLWVIGTRDITNINNPEAIDDSGLDQQAPEFYDFHIRTCWYGPNRNIPSIISTIICLIMAFPLALTLKGKKLDKGSLIVFIFILPMWMNFLLRTLAWLSLLEKNGIINTVLKFMHLPGLNIINTPAAIILGMVYNYLPFMVLPIYNVLEKIDDNTINAARDLGANTLQTIIKVIIPLSIPGIVSGITMVFVPALTTFVISNILGGSKVLLIGNVIEQEFTKGSNWNLGSGLSLIMMIFILISMAFIAKYDKDGEGMSV